LIGTKKPLNKIHPSGALYPNFCGAILLSRFSVPRIIYRYESDLAIITKKEIVL